MRLFDFNTKITVFTMKYDQDSFDWRQSYDFFLTFSIIIKQCVACLKTRIFRLLDTQIMKIMIVELGRLGVVRLSVTK